MLWIICLLHRADDGTGKSTPIKRGPGRPRKRKYFGASFKGDKSSPGPPTGYNKEGEERLLMSGTQSPELNAVASESESLVSKESEPPKKKKKRAKQKSPVERDERGSAPPSHGFSPVEFTVSGMMLGFRQYLFSVSFYLFVYFFLPVFSLRIFQSLLERKRNLVSQLVWKRRYRNTIDLWLL